MNVDLDALIRCLDLPEVEPGVVEGQNLDIGYHRVFGGQILAQVLAAAGQASPEKSVKSLHLLFPREGDTSKPMQYSVAKLQDGRTFGATEVVADFVANHEFKSIHGHLLMTSETAEHVNLRDIAFLLGVRIYSTVMPF